jgi:GNAT superfamily N-acetyltransferase
MRAAKQASLAPLSARTRRRPHGTSGASAVLLDVVRELVTALDEVTRTPGAIYDLCKRIDNHPGPGTFPVMGARVFTYVGLRARQLFYEPLSSYNTILAAAYLRAKLDQAYCPRQYLDHLMISFQAFDGAYTAPEGRLALPQPGERPLGNHAVQLAGWDDDGERLVFANSWGRNWGMRGFGSVGRDYLDKYLDEAWLMRNARYGMSPVSWERLSGAASDAELVRAWLTDNPRRQTKVRLGGRAHRLFSYSTLSMEHECRADVVELRTAVGLRAGWAILFHVGGSSRKTVIKELFVWPPYRRRGYGTILEEAAVHLARSAGSTQLELILLAADALPRSRAAGRLFAEAAGYSWRWRSTKRPSVAGVAWKEI